MIELPPRDYQTLVDQIAGEISTLLARAPQPLPSSGAAQLAAAIEHTLLAPDATRSQIEQLCAEAQRFNFLGVCVHPAWVPLAAAALRGTPILVVAVVGFPLGATLGSVKRAEAAECLKLGADELDMVINLGALKSGQDGLVGAEIRGVVELAHAAGARVKVILETALLTEPEKLRACALASAAGADFVKTSTGFAASGATVADVVLLRAAAGAAMGVKASGGIRDLPTAQAMLRAGATRIGTSSGPAILAQLPAGPPLGA